MYVYCWMYSGVWVFQTVSRYDYIIISPVLDQSPVHSEKSSRLW